MLSKKEISNAKCFISYSRESAAHNRWVLELASSLRMHGVDVAVDREDVTPGLDFTEYMEQRITEAHYILAICTPTYKQKFDKREGGVGYEARIMLALLMHKPNMKIVPVLRKNSIQTSVPIALMSFDAVDASSTGDNSDGLERLIALMRSAPEAISPESVPATPRTRKAVTASKPIEKQRQGEAVFIGGAGVPELGGIRETIVFVCLSFGLHVRFREAAAFKTKLLAQENLELMRESSLLIVPFARSDATNTAGVISALEIGQAIAVATEQSKDRNLLVITTQSAKPFDNLGYDFVQYSGDSHKAIPSIAAFLYVHSGQPRQASATAVMSMKARFDDDLDRMLDAQQPHRPEINLLDYSTVASQWLKQWR